MRFYHFTAEENLRGIAAEGLRFGDVPTSPTDGVQAVWLTTSPDSAGHGLPRVSRVMTEAERAMQQARLGVPVPAGLFWPDKQRFRFSIDLEPDLALAQWSEWAVLRGIPRSWRKTLERAGGRQAKTWWLYFGTIAPEALGGGPIDLRTGLVWPGWPDVF